MKILLSTLPDVCNDTITVVPPLGLQYIASNIKDGHEVHLLDMNLNWENPIRKDGNQILIGIAINEFIEGLEQIKPDIIGFTCNYSYQHDFLEAYIKQIKKHFPDVKVIAGGNHITAYHKDHPKLDGLDSYIMGEGEEAFNLYLEGKMEEGKTYHVKDLDSLKFPNRKGLERYFKINKLHDSIHKEGNRVATVITSRGCPYNCLSGKTLINTVEGKIPIKDLVGRNKIGVYTYNPKTGEVSICDGINITYIGKKETIKITFDDGSNIECTKDHKFLTFKNGNQFTKTKEKQTKAENLRPGDSVIAIKETTTKYGYIQINWRRKKRNRNRMVAEYMLGRKLNNKEIVHHIDKNKKNDLPENIKVCKNSKEHFSFHPEISIRMKKDNPSRYNTKESYEIISKKNTGLVRTFESRMKYRKSKLGTKNPNYKHGRCKRPSRIKEINHRVKNIEYVGFQDVYDLEVPSTHWFFANDVLVHNCIFCSVKNIWGRGFRPRSPENVIAEVKELIEKYQITEVHFEDDNLLFDKVRMLKICELLKPLNIRWTCPNGVDMSKLDYDLVKAMQESGCYRITICPESFNDEILKFYRKPFNTKIIEEKIHLIKQFPIELVGFFILGAPMEEECQMIKTISLAVNYFDSFDVSFLAAYPGTDLWEYCKENDLFINKDEAMQRINCRSDYSNTIKRKVDPCFMNSLYKIAKILHANKIAFARKE